MLVKDTIDLLDRLETKVEAASQETINRLQTKSKDMAIVMSVPGRRPSLKGIQCPPIVR
jgi:transposase